MSRVNEFAALVLACYSPVFRDESSKRECIIPECRKQGAIGLVWKPEHPENREYPVWVCVDCYNEMREIVNKRIMVKEN